MAHLTQPEFFRAMTLLAEDLGLQRLRDRFVRLNALVTRRRAASAQSLADQLYMLTSGLRRQVPATVAFHSIWSERISAQLGEEGEKALEQIAEEINRCLDRHEHVIEEKEAELGEVLRRYERRLADAVGDERARIDMLLKAVPAVATKLRAAFEAPAPPPSPASGGAGGE